MTPEQLIGQKLMIGISGSKATPEVIQLFRDTHAGGLIVFRPNFESVDSFRQLISALESALDRKLLIAVDHEGGRVVHIPQGATFFPDNLALGQTQNQHYASSQGEIEARELRRLGFDLNLAPTLDVLTENFSPNIGIRSYGKYPDLVSKLGCARIKAMQANGLSACAKHFPGQGHSSIDAHLGLPVLNTTWEEMNRIHIQPFVEAIKCGVHTMMSSHPVYPLLDPEKVPATFSRRIIHDYLRKDLEFKGAILSDDLEMGALKNICPIGESAVRAVEAGHDMVLICHGETSIREAYQSLLSAYRSNRLNQEEMECSFERIEKLKQLRSNRFTEGKPAAESKGKDLAEAIAEMAIEVTSNNAKEDQDLLDPHPSVIFPKLSILNQRIAIEMEQMNETQYITSIFRESGIQPKEIHALTIDPNENEIMAIEQQTVKAKTIVYFCFDAHLYLNEKKLLERLKKRDIKLITVFLRDPYDKDFLNEKDVYLNAFGFRSAQIKSAVKKIATLYACNEGIPR